VPKIIELRKNNATVAAVGPNYVPDAWQTQLSNLTGVPLPEPRTVEKIIERKRAKRDAKIALQPQHVQTHLKTLKRVIIG